MGLGYSKFKFNLDGVIIETTVTKDGRVVRDIIDSILHPAVRNERKIIGLDIEWFLFKEFIYSSTECATLHLCDGRSCLIIQLRHLDSVPISLLNFLRLPDYTFVGVGIKKNLAKLEKRYGIGCKNAAELGPLAAEVKRRPLLSVSGVDELVSSVVGRSFNLGVNMTLAKIRLNLLLLLHDWERAVSGVIN